jgi:aspartate/methionine/tyrosine aminotransferase
MRKVYGRGGVPVDVSEEDIAVTAGCNMAYVAAAMTLADAGDEIILPVPWCVSFELSALVAHAEVTQVLQPSVRDAHFHAAFRAHESLE